MVTHGMIDLETLGTTQDSVVLTIGAAKFSPFNTNEPTDKLYLKLDTSDQVEKGRIIDEGTLKWWGQQDEEVRKDTFSEHDRICVEDALDTLALERSNQTSKIERFDFTIAHMERMIGINEEAIATINDFDEASEMAKLTGYRIEQQTAIALMAQAQQLSAGVLQLLQG